MSLTHCQEISIACLHRRRLTLQSIVSDHFSSSQHSHRRSQRGWIRNRRPRSRRHYLSQARIFWRFISHYFQKRQNGPKKRKGISFENQRIWLRLMNFRNIGSKESGKRLVLKEMVLSAPWTSSLGLLNSPCWMFVNLIERFLNHTRWRLKPRLIQVSNSPRLGMNDIDRPVSHRGCLSRLVRRHPY